MPTKTEFFNSAHAAVLNHPQFGEDALKFERGQTHMNGFCVFQSAFRGESIKEFMRVLEVPDPKNLSNKMPPQSRRHRPPGDLCRISSSKAQLTSSGKSTHAPNGYDWTIPIQWNSIIGTHSHHTQ
jgi:hypothetical protein